MSDPLFWALVVFIPFVLGYALATLERSRRRRGSDAALRAVDLANIDASVRTAAGLQPDEPIPPPLRRIKDGVGLLCHPVTVPSGAVYCFRCRHRVRDKNNPPKCGFLA